MLVNKGRPCPHCGGKDRFRFDDKNGLGTWYCNKCGAGDGFSLLQAVNGWNFAEAARRVEEMLGIAPRGEPARPERKAEDKHAIMRSLWRGAKPVQPGDPVALWLERRTGNVIQSNALRSHRRVLYRDADDAAPRYMPAMLAAALTPDGRSAVIHRTYLTEQGDKADVPAPRKMMATIPKGSAVRLFPKAPTMGIAEGIETAISAAAMFGLPVWAALNADLLAAWEAPKGIERIVIFGDHDASYTGQAAAFTLAKRLGVLGIKTDVELPPTPGDDWNDAHRRQRTAA